MPSSVWCPQTHCRAAHTTSAPLRPCVLTPTQPVNALIGYYVVSDSLLMSLLYVWSRRFPGIRMTYLFGISFSSEYLPAVLTVSRALTVLIHTVFSLTQCSHSHPHIAHTTPLLSTMHTRKRDHKRTKIFVHRFPLSPHPVHPRVCRQPTSSWGAPPPRTSRASALDTSTGSSPPSSHTHTTYGVMMAMEDERCG